MLQQAEGLVCKTRGARKAIRSACGVIRACWLSVSNVQVADRTGAYAGNIWKAHGGIDDRCRVRKGGQREGY